MTRTRRQFLSTAGATIALPSLAHSRSKPTRAKVRLAVVGGGFGARHHWHEHPDCEVTAVSDLVEARRKRLVRSYGCNAVYPSLEKMLEKAHKSFDAVAVFTDAPSHAKHTLMCMEYGKHVVCACPVATTIEDMAKIEAKKRETGLIYMMHESSWYRQECIAARELYRDKAFGRLAYSEVEYYHPGIGTKSNNLSRWQGKDSWRRGFPPMLYPTHSLGLLTGVTGERIVRVSCMGQLVGDDFPAGKDNVYDNPYDNEMAIGYTDKGNICRFGVFWQIAAHGERGQWLGEKLVVCDAEFARSGAGQTQAARPLAKVGRAQVLGERSPAEADAAQQWPRWELDVSLRGVHRGGGRGPRADGRHLRVDRDERAWDRRARLRAQGRRVAHGPELRSQGQVNH